MKKTTKILLSVILIIILTIIIYFTYLATNKDTDKKGNIITNFFPNILDFIQNSDIKIPLVTNSNNDEESKEDLFYQIPNHISADFILNTSSSTVATSSIESTSNFIVSAEKTTGHLYFYDLEDKIMTRLSNTTISDIDSVYSSYDKERLYIYLSTPLATNRQDYSYNFNPETIESRVTNVIKLNSFTNIIGAVNNLLYWKNTDTNFIYKGNANLENAEIVINNSKIDWLYKTSNNELFGNQKPSAFKNTSAYLFKINALEKIISNKNNLTILPSPDGQYILYTNTNRTYLYDMKTNASTQLSFFTPIEKCSWVEDSLSFYCSTPTTNSFSITDWYMGISQLTDSQIVSINVDNPQKFYPTIYLPEGIDVEKLKTINEGGYIVFKNKIDKSLWVLKLII